MPSLAAYTCGRGAALRLVALLAACALVLFHRGGGPSWLGTQVAPSPDGVEHLRKLYIQTVRCMLAQGPSRWTPRLRSC